ncbi:SDR family NAD(P)-dependent oxidoreductase [Xenorhabdus griffiniae]|uniref:SDR family NAD(P)-dependent oxidoreductase n=1 Tax=Xenorhabdus griffiniae TaxID=351672 RepID=A0ABY9XME8_9GAMM|nr:SDR family NAD(P)-dependent oxidoreductase [Xenorhabdus griffiniae]MBD1227090.1 SDR family NAD(P)-dependent oxidoreductase [Xenorhabdus griffiniae]MBE8586735.1 SDR family NAD(P)-dependent oxidoreductase [Xenorhabdus griffiniae]WMV74112.1 SDR family NAD(P)-dependent oxidoreductase [Xenorhabdus griffiniae]WNH03792.1 SDR family NAD(P)-dependent oxidoreductase [Xenorhabdus griffiniae]
MEYSIIGVAAQFCGGLSLSHYWQTLVEGGSLMRVINEERYQLNNRQTSVKWGGREKIRGMFLEDIDSFDRHIFPLSGSAIMFADPRQRLFLQTCWQLLEDAGLAASTLSGKKVGVFVAQDGWYLNSYVDRIPDEHKESQEFIVPGNDPCFLANRVSFFFNFNGPSIVVDTTCSSAFVALDMACQALECGDCDYAIVGGVSLFLNPWKAGETTATPFETGGEDIHSFSEKASGYRTSEGCAALFLQRNSDEVNQRHYVYGVVQASGHNSGGKTNSFAQPNKEQQINLFQTVLKRANLLPEQIHYVEAHGVASQMGDAIEANALVDVFARSQNTSPCYVSTVKPNIGHNHASSGFYAIIKGLMAFRYNQIPLIRGLNNAELNADIPANTQGIQFLTETVDWPQSQEGAPRHIFFSSYGFSNVNAAIVLREPDNPPAAKISPLAETVTEKPVLVCLSARSDEQLYQQAVNLCKTVSEPDFAENFNLHELAWTLSTGREAFTHRWATLVSSIEQLRCALEVFVESPEKQKATIYLGQNVRETALTAQHAELDVAANNGFPTESLETVAKCWVAGVDIDWMQYWGGAEWRRIPLPAYPLAKARYWVPEGEVSRLSSQEVSSQEGSSQFIHPFVHQNTSDFAEQRFSTTFSGEEFCLKGHVIHGIRVLPGVGHLELARVAAHHSFGTTPNSSLAEQEKTGLTLKNVVWAQIIGVIDEPQRIHIRFINHGNGEAGYQLYSRAEKETIHNSGVATRKALTPAPVYDIDSLKSRYLQNAYSPKQYYDMYYVLGLYMAPDYQGIEELYVGMDHVLAKLSLPESLAPTREQFVLHPCLMDGALLSSVGLLMRFGDLNRPIPPKCLIPFALDEIEFHDEESQLHWAWISYSVDSSASDPFPKVDVDCCDINGKVCIRFKGFSCRGLGAQSAPPAETEPYLLQPQWKSQALPSDTVLRVFTKRIVFLCELERLQSESFMSDTDTCEYIVLPKLSRDEVPLKRHQNVITLCKKIDEIINHSPAEPMFIQLVLPEALPEYAIVTARLKTAYQDNANLLSQTIYCDDKERLAEKLSAETSQIKYDTVRWQSEERWVPHWTVWTPENGSAENLTPPWKEKSVYLIIDEDGSMGRVIARDITTHTDSAIAIVLNETGLNESEKNQYQITIASKTTTINDGVICLDAATLAALVSRIEQNFGALRGGFFCVGKRSQHVENETLSSILERYQGLSLLEKATQGTLLDFFTVLTYRDGVLGCAEHPLFSAYCAAANNFVRHHQQRSQRQTLSLILPQSSGANEEEFIRHRALQSLYQALHEKFSGELMLMEGGAIERFRAEMLGVRPYYEPTFPSNSENNVNSFVTQVSQSQASSDLRSTAVDLIKRVVSKAVSLPLAEIDEDAGMEKYGIDSILSIKMTEALEQNFGVLPKTLFFEYLTIRQLAAYFVKHHHLVLLGQSQNNPQNIQPTSTMASSRLPVQPISGRTESLAVSQTGKAKYTTTELDDIAIVGLAGRFPQARNMRDFWQLLREGQDCITEIPSQRWDNSRYFDMDKTKRGKTYGKWGGFIEGVDEFDPLFFNLSPRDARVMSPQERLFLQCAYETIEDAGYSHRTLGSRDWTRLPKKMGVYVGVMYGEYEFYSIEELAKGNVLEQSIVTGSFGSIANRVSHFFNINGPSLAVDTMCSSSLTSIYLACQALRQGDIEMALAGGVNVSIHPNKYLILGQSKFLSDEGRCQSFGEGGTGYVPSEGVGAVLLKPLTKAIEDGDHIYGVIKGIAVNHGGKTNGYTVPNPIAQADVIVQAIQSSGVNPRAISYIEAHGTGTSLGDPIEIAGLNRAFQQCLQGNDIQESAFCAIGSVKSNIGHCESAAGIAGVAKVLMQIKHRQLVPSLHSRELNPNIDFDASPFYVQRELADWKRPLLGDKQEPSEHPRTAGISSFGAGGTNAHLVVQEYIPANDLHSIKNTDWPKWAVIPLSAKNHEQHRELAQTLSQYLREQAKWCSETSKAEYLHSLAYTLQTGREEMEERATFMVDSLSTLIDSLKAFSLSCLPSTHFWMGRVEKSKSTKQLMTSVYVGKDQHEEEYEQLKQIASAWTQGHDIDWQGYYQSLSVQPTRLSLPTYPFARERYWIPESEAQTAVLPAAVVEDIISTEETSSTVFYTSGWERCDIRQNTAYAMKPKRTDSFVIGNVNETSLTELTSLAGVENIHYLRAEPDLHPNSQYSVSLSDLVLRLVDYCQQRIRTGQALPECIAVFAPWKENGLPYRALLGALRTLSMEFPAVQTKLILDAALDNADGETFCRHAEKELLSSNQLSSAVCYQETGQRFVWRQKAVEPTALMHLPSLFNHACRTIWITGGLGGLGYQIAQYIGTKTGAQLVLSGRSVLDADKAAQLNALRKRGIKAEYEPCDVNNRQALEKTLLLIRQRFGALHGVIHCAGVIHDALTVNKTEEEIYRVIATKASAVCLLDEVTQHEPLAFFVMFSSLASLGNIGQIDYAAANAFLDTFAEYRENLVQQKQRSGKSLSINWPLWQEGGMNVTPRVEKHMFDTFGIVPLETKTALETLEIALRSPFPQFGVMKGDAQKIGDYLRLSDAPSPVTPLSASDNEDLDFVSPNESDNSADTVADIVADITAGKLSELLGMRSEAIDIHRQFGDYGMDSVGLIELAEYINSRFEVTLSQANFLEFNTLHRVAEHLIKLLPEPTLSAPSDTSSSDMSSPVMPASVSEPSFAIVGYDCMFPGAKNAQAYWQNMIQKTVSIQGITQEAWQQRHILIPSDKEDAVKRMQSSGFLQDIDQFDAEFWGIDAETAKQIDPQQRLLMQCIWRCVEHAGYDLEDLTQHKVGLFVAVDSTDYKSLIKDHALINNTGKSGGLQAGLSLGMMVNQISYFFNFTGPSEVVDNACASVFVALQKARQAMLQGDCDVAIVAGVKVILDFMEFYIRDQGGILSQSGKMAPFDYTADGYIRGEGVGAVMIKPLEQACLEHDPVRAIIRGVGVSHNGRSAFSSMAPSVEKQEENIRKAYQSAGIDPCSVDYIEAHGSATQFNDVSEVAAFKKVFSENQAVSHRCVVSAVKGNIGHLEAASGIASLIKVILAMKHEVIPPIASFSQLPPSIFIENTPLFFPCEPVLWQQASSDKTQPRRAGLNSIGITGVNAHVILEAPDQLAMPVLSQRREHAQRKEHVLIPISAKSEKTLKAYLSQWLDFVRQEKSVGHDNAMTLRNLAYSAQTGRADMPFRTAIIVNDLEKLIATLEWMIAGENGTPPAGAVEMGVVPPKSRSAKKQVAFSTTLPVLKQLADDWVAGACIDWRAFAQGHGVYVDIPSYPFDEQRYWFL